jgi:tetratricopeptide (TPR) repeat protein
MLAAQPTVIKPILNGGNSMNRFCSSLFFLTLVLGLFATQTQAQQVSLNANPLDPFPANTAELLKIADRVPAIREAIEYFRTGNADKLKDSLLAARTSNGEFPKVDVMLARMFMANGQWQDAYQVLENHVALNATDAEAFKNFAEIAMVSGRWTDAWLQLEKAVSLIDGMQFSAPRKQNFTAELLKLRAEVADQRQDTSTATKLFQELAKMQPKDGAPLWALGQIKLRSGDNKGGLELLKQAKALTPSLPQPELILARIVASKDRKAANDLFLNSLKIKDGVTEANWLAYLQFLIDDERIDDAKKVIDSAPDEYKKLRDFRLITAILLRFQGKNAEAEAIFSALHQENPDDMVAADHLALIMVESSEEGKRARAERISENNVRIAPNSERTLATAAWVKFKTGATDIADKALGQILRGGRLEPQTAYYAAMLLKSRGLTGEYQRFLQACVDGPGAFPQKAAARKELEQLKAKANNATAPATKGK